MAEQNKNTLKSYFNKGDIVTEANMANLIDSFPNRKQLSTTNPRSTGEEADIDTIGVGLDESRWVKTGANDTDWRKMIIGNESDKISDEAFPELVIAGLRQGTKSELDAADPALLSNEPAYETDTEVFRIGSKRFIQSNVLEVATNQDKLELTNLEVGQEIIITGEGNRIERYLGDLGYGGLIVTGAGTSDANGTHHWVICEDNSSNSPSPAYFLEETQYGFRKNESGYWEIGGNSWNDIYYTADDIADTPADVLSWTVETTGTSPAPSVTYSAEAGNKNWEIMGQNTCEIFIKKNGFKPK